MRLPVCLILGAAACLAAGRERFWDEPLERLNTFWSSLQYDAQHLIGPGAHGVFVVAKGRFASSISSRARRRNPMSVTPSITR